MINITMNFGFKNSLLFSAHIVDPADCMNSALISTATLFLEFWKRHRASYVCEWKVSDWCEEEV